MAHSTSIIPLAHLRAVQTGGKPGDHPGRVLVVSSREEDATKLQRMLGRGTDLPYVCEPVPAVRDAMRRLGGRAPFKAAVVDADALGDVGLAGLAKLCQLDLRVPVLVLSSRRDDPPVAEAIRRGAQDVLLRTELTPERLALALACGIERGRHLAELRDLSVTDPLTGLCNRRGLRLLGEAHVRLLRRTRRQSLLLYADVDGLKGINDRHGHAAGDRALLLCARALQRSLRGSDIVARYGGDEFVALALDVVNGAGALVLARITASLRAMARSEQVPFELTLSVGAATCGRGRHTLDQILASADQALYGQKRRRGLWRPSPPDDPEVA